MGFRKFSVLFIDNFFPFPDRLQNAHVISKIIMFPLVKPQVNQKVGTHSLVKPQVIKKWEQTLW